MRTHPTAVGIFLLAGLLLALPHFASAAGLSSLTWTIDSSQSFSSLAATDFSFPVSGGPTVVYRTRNQTGGFSAWTQGNKASVGGTIDTLYNKSVDNAIQFTANQPGIVGINSGTYRPNPAAWNAAATNAGYGAPDNTTGASGVFGAQVYFDSIVESPAAMWSMHNVFFNLSSSSALPIGGGAIGSLNAASTNFGISNADFTTDGFYYTLAGLQRISDVGPGNIESLASALGGANTTATGVVTTGVFPGGANRQLKINVTMPVTWQVGNVAVAGTETTQIVAYANVPEPSTLSLAAVGAVGLLGFARRRMRRRVPNQKWLGHKTRSH